MPILRAWCLLALGLYTDSRASDDRGAALTPSAAVGPLEPLLQRARRRIRGANSHTCAGGPGTGRAGPNFFLTRAAASRGVGSLRASEYAVIDSVFFNHPLATVIIIAAATLDEAIFDSYLQEGYCVLVAPLTFAWIRGVFVAAEPTLSEEQFNALVSDQRHLPLLVNSLLLALQIVESGVALAMNTLLVNPFDMLLPSPLSLETTAVFLEKTFDPEEPQPSVSLERDDFEKSWAPRSHTDRQDGRTMICGNHLCPRSMPAGSPLGRRLLTEWLASFVSGIHVDFDGLATKVYKMYSARGAAVFQEGALRYAALALPGWVITEPHFPDGWRRHGNRGREDEFDDLTHFHSQLFSPRPHREKSDWWLVRSLKLLIPLDYGPASGRNGLPRSVVDLSYNLLSLRIAARAPVWQLFSSPPDVSQDDRRPSQRGLRTPADALDMLDNNMAESLGLGQSVQLPREAALPGAMGGYRTFRDIRVIGRGQHCSEAADGEARVRVVVRFKEPRSSILGADELKLTCRPGARPEATGEVGAFEQLAFAACQSGLQANPKGFFDLMGSPAVVNAAIALLAYKPQRAVKAPESTMAFMDGQLDRSRGAVDARQTAAELDAHFSTLLVEVFDLGCSSHHAVSTEPTSPSVDVALKALVDDVEDLLTVVAHSASRCDLLVRLGLSFRTLYAQLPILVSCECPAGFDLPFSRLSCSEDGSSRRAVEDVPHMTILDVPYDFGLSRGKRLLARAARTEFILVLDDDFVRSPLSCLECMLWHMRSPLHQLTLPFDLLGFPILEDERNFGAFRGQLRTVSGRLLLEPMAGETFADGVVRVGIHPMAFLARTARFRTFRFQDNLRVGEHEHFFYANQYFGLHAALCFDSTFPHFRVPMSDSYRQRRERMQELMSQEFEKIGFPSVMYLLHKYDALNGDDAESLISKDVGPWSVSDDTCGPMPDPPTEFSMFFAAVISTPDARGLQYRQVLRSCEAAWLPRLAAVAGARWAFFVNEVGEMPLQLLREEEEYGDMVFIPAGVDAFRLRYVLSFLRDFQYRWLFVVQHDAFVYLDPIFSALGRFDPPYRASIQSSRHRAEGEGSGEITSEFFALSRDVAALLASHRVAHWLRTDIPIGAALHAWLAPLAIRSVNLPGVYTSPSTGAQRCPADVSILHPVSPDDLVLLSNAALRGPPCTILSSSS